MDLHVKIRPPITWFIDIIMECNEDWGLWAEAEI